ncbi:hypothetical protein [Lysobacter gummosus]|uniref:hypothetical protein n=1 Tax=Lysobacter gummosus TaxID=262324 RepID=UPI0036450D1E
MRDFGAFLLCLLKTVHIGTILLARNRPSAVPAVSRDKPANCVTNWTASVQLPAGSVDDGLRTGRGWRWSAQAPPTRRCLSTFRPPPQLPRLLRRLCGVPLSRIDSDQSSGMQGTGT